MPFTPELHYFYLYLEQYLGQKHGIRCERADYRILTKPLLEKINDQIAAADVIIADCTGRNANVFYELGIAHARSKPVVLITGDAIEEAPSDVRHFEFIRYELDRHTEFLNKLDNALHNVFAGEYQELYQHARALLQAFRQQTGAQVEQAPEQVFVARVRWAERDGHIPPIDDELAEREYLLPKIIAEPSDSEIHKQVWQWLYTQDEQG